MSSASSSAEPGPAPRGWQRPLLIGSLAFLLGVYAGGWRLAYLAALLAVPPLVALATRRAAWLLVGLAVALGLGRAALDDLRWARQPLAAWAGRTATLRVEVDRPPVARAAGGERVDLRVRAGQVGPAGWQPLRGRVQLLTDGPAPVALGQRVELRLSLRAPRTAGTPGAFSQAQWLRRGGVAMVAEADGPPRVVGQRGAGAWARAGGWARARLCGALARALPGPARAQAADVLNALVFGLYAAPVAEPVEEAFRRVGLAHLLVASGTQVSLLVVLVLWLGATLGLRPTTQFALGLGLVGGYCLVTGPEPSIIRAALMGGLILWAAVLGRDYDLLTALGFTAALQVALWPPIRGDLAFGLSYLATAGVVLVGLPLSAAWEPRLGRWLASVLAFSLGAQLFVAPLLVYSFRELAWVGLLSNVPALPIAGLLVPLGLLAALVGLVWPGGATLLLVPGRALLDLLVGGAGAMSRWRWGYMESVVMTPTGLAALVAGLTVVALAVVPDDDGGSALLAWLRRVAARWERERVVAVLLAIAVPVLGVLAWRALHPELRLHVLDVGQGDALLVRGPRGATMLIDGGPRELTPGGWVDTGERVVVPALMLLGVRRLDDVIATHAHIDHLGGLPAVLSAYRPARLWLTAPTRAAGGEELERLLATAATTGTEVRELVGGASLDLGGGAAAEVLWPAAGAAPRSVNDGSLVLRLRYGRVGLLLAGDLEATGEQALVTSGQALASNLLKVPHQGSRTSCSELLLDAVRPTHAVISVGPNSYGHPAPETVARLRARGIDLHRTDLGGMVTYATDGARLRQSAYGRR